MSEKMTCPACGAHLSSVLIAYRAGAPCPSCGLSAGAAAEILRIQATRADEALRAQLTEEVRRRDQAEARAKRAEQQLAQIREVLAEPPEENPVNPWSSYGRGEAW